MARATVVLASASPVGRLGLAKAAGAAIRKLGGGILGIMGLFTSI
ncbi:MAG: hypothetical protein PHC33_00905 [Candidatus Omnitrophica bacterium]|nr:hypothetical protein [Candidatus Omnitrophota bacterium]